MSGAPTHDRTDECHTDEYLADECLTDECFTGECNTDECLTKECLTKQNLTNECLIYRQTRYRRTRYGLPTTASPRALDEGRQGALRHSDGAHAVMHPAGPQPSLSDLEAPPFSQEDAGERHSHVPAPYRPARKHGTEHSRKIHRILLI